MKRKGSGKSEFDGVIFIHYSTQWNLEKKEKLYTNTSKVSTHAQPPAHPL